VVEKKDISAKG